MAAAMLAPTPPTSSPSTFEEFLSNATNDRYSGQYPALMLPFIIDGVNANVAPAAVRDQVVEATTQHEAVCLVALTADNKLHPFFLPFTSIKPALGAMEDLSIITRFTHSRARSFWV
jgi:hypothetical protein